MNSISYKKNYQNRVSASLFLISFSIFSYQVCLIRILSISDYYHFAFMIVSIALLGFGISGSFLYYFINKFKSSELILLVFSFGFSVSIILSFIITNLIPFDSFKIAWELRQIFYLIIYYLFLLLPFFFGGSFIGYIFYRRKKPGITYFYNLTGSAAGSLGTIFIIPYISEHGVVFFSAILGLVSTFVVVNKKYLKKFLTFGLIFLAVIISIWNYIPEAISVRMSPYKSLPSILRIPDSKILYTGKNAYSRVDVIESESIKSYPGISLQYKQIPPRQLGITIDGDNLSPITKALDIKSMDFLEYLPHSVPFSLKTEPENVLIVEPGGGMDVLCSLYFDSKNVYVVENNELVIGVLKEKFSEFSGNIYNFDNLKVYDTSSRNFSLVTPVKFDLIIVSLQDSYRPIFSGAYSLNENYLYTTKSISDLIDILGEDGVLVITRWAQYPPSENLKIISTLLEGAKSSGIGDVRDKIFSYRSWSTLTTLFKKNYFLLEEKDILKEKVWDLNYDVVYYRDAEESEVNIYNKIEEPYFYNFFKKILEEDYKERNNFYNSYYFNIEPSTDDKPYFFNFFKFEQIPDIIRYFGKTTQPFGGGGYLILVFALIISSILSVFFILLPLKIKKVNIKIKRDFGYLIYFFSIGFGFFFIELPFIQKFILVLGKPAYSLAIILFSLLLAAGLGSYTINYYKIDLRIVILCLCIYVITFIYCFRFIGDFLISRVLWQRFIFTVLFVMPVGFFMGMPFPTGIAKAKEKRGEIIPWLWAINGCASVVGSIVAVIISIHLGFFTVIGISLALYVLALASYRFFLD